MRNFISLLTLFIFFFACSHEDQPLTDYPNSHLLHNASGLNELLSNSEIFLIDARQEVGDTLIPGATHFAAVQELTDTGHPIEFFMIGPDLFQEKMRNLGLRNNDQVVIYDDGNNLAAARLFYALDYYGFSNTSLLNGGLQAWLETDLPIGSELTEYAPGNFTVSVQDALVCDFEYIREASGSPDKIIFDARSVSEYTGEDTRSIHSGHIPNAVNLEWSQVLESDGIPYFLPASEIQEKYAALGITPDKEVIPHCHTNVRGSHAYFTLRLMGYDSVRPYEGSWSEYGNHQEAIVE